LAVAKVNQDFGSLQAPAIRIVIFTGSDEARDEQRAREVGAAAYVRKEHIGAVLLAAIHLVGKHSEPDSNPVREKHTLEAAVALS
jgi:DNA-binding NarL/FixJ family response regulator